MPKEAECPIPWVHGAFPTLRAFTFPDGDAVEHHPVPRRRACPSARSRNFPAGPCLVVPNARGGGPVLPGDGMATMVAPLSLGSGFEAPVHLSLARSGRFAVLARPFHAVAQARFSRGGLESAGPSSKPFSRFARRPRPPGRCRWSAGR